MFIYNIFLKVPCAQISKSKTKNLIYSDRSINLTGRMVIIWILDIVQDWGETYYSDLK